MQLTPMMWDLYQDDHSFVVLRKSAQIGASEYLINLALFVCDTGQGDRGNSLYVMPAQVQAADFAAARINKALRESPSLLERVRPKPSAVSTASKTMTRQVGEGHLYVRGAESRRQLIAVDADLLILDELDTMGEGTLDVARRRLDSSTLRWIRLASTPSIPNIGIDAWFRLGDQRYWYITCQDCKLEQTLDWPDSIDEERLGVVCTKCGDLLNTQGPGRWIATRSEGTDVHSYHLSRLYSPTLDVAQLVAASKATDPVGIREFFNSDLGLAYAGEGDAIDFGTLDACRRDYRLLPQAERAVMGVDVGAKLHVVVRRRDPVDPESSQLIYAATVDSFEALDSLMSRYHVYCCVVDSLPETHAARQFASRWPGRTWLCRYQNRSTGPAWDSSEYLVTTDRTASLDALYGGMRAGRATLPRNARELGGELRDDASAYYRHLCALTRSLVADAAGNMVNRYVQSGPDHFAHAENYCNLAFEKLPWSSGSSVEVGRGRSRLEGLPGRHLGGSRLSGMPGRIRK